MINFSRNTIGCNVSGKIFVHPDLHRYPELYNAIIKHEKKHSNGINGRDVSIDMFNDDIKGYKKEFYKFMLLHPRTLLGYLPVNRIGKYWTFDVEMLVVWIFVVIVSYLVGANL